MKQQTRRTATLILRILLVLLLIINIVIITIQSTEGLKFLDKLPFSLLPIYGGSMEPVLSSGDVILTVRSPYDRLERGDIVVFVRDDELVAHEIIAINGDELVTKGSANEVADEPVNADDYKAKVITSVPFIGAMWRISAKPFGFILFAVLLTLLVFGNQVFGYLYKKLTGESEQESY